MSDPTVPPPQTTAVDTTVATTAVPPTTSPAPVTAPSDDPDADDPDSDAETGEPRTEEPSAEYPDADAGGLATLVDFTIDYDDDSRDGPIDYLVGRDLASGLWQWSDNSANSCIFIAVAPESWSSAPGESQRRIISQADADRLWWLDARNPVALVHGEAVVGYNRLPVLTDMIAGTSHPECFLGRIGDNTAPDEEIYSQRHDAGSGGIEGGEDLSFEEAEPPVLPEGDGSWECRAHRGPEPADRLDWRDDPNTSRPEVSCVVGVGISPGWWQWNEFSAPSCIYVVVDTGDELDQMLHRNQKRRDAREPILLREGEIVKGYSESKGESSSFIAGTSHPECFLEHIAPEDEPSA